MFKVGEEPEGVSVHPDGNHVYVTSEEDGAVYVVDVAARQGRQVGQGRTASAFDCVSARWLARVRAV